MKEKTIIFAGILMLVVFLVHAEVYERPDATTVEQVNQYTTVHPISDATQTYPSYYQTFKTTAEPQKTLNTGAERKTDLTQDEIPLSYKYASDLTIKTLPDQAVDLTQDTTKLKQLVQDMTLPEVKELPTLKYEIPKVVQKERIAKDAQELTQQRIEQVKQPIAKPQLKQIDTTNKFITKGIEPVPLTSKNLDINQRRYLKKIIDLNINSNIKNLDPIDVNGKEYEVAYVETEGKLLGFIPVKSKEYYMIDPINEQVISEKKPWWDSLTIN